MATVDRGGDPDMTIHRNVAQPRIAARLMIVALLMLPFARPASSWNFTYSAMSESDSVRRATETKLFRHELKARRKGTRLRVHLSLDQGAARVTLEDPHGKVRWDHAFKAGNATVEETFDGPSGMWRIAMNLKDATGRYAVSLVDY
jgi:hypothetical protein